MNNQIRHVMAVLMAAFVILFAQLNRVQVFQAEELRQHPENTRTVQRDFGQNRGRIVTADGVVVARSEATADSSFEHLRVYPEAELYAHVTGYVSFTVGADGVERSYNDDLTGRSGALQLSGITELLGDGDPTGELVLALRHDLQTAAAEALGARPGAVVALEPETGNILAMYSWPTFDPNLLSGHDGTAVNEAYRELTADPANPLRSGAYRERYFPGSTFKVVTAASALDTGVATLTQPVFEVRQEYTPPLTSRGLANFGGSACGGNIADLLRVSCNTGFAELGAELLGPERLIDTAQAFGFNAVPPLDLPAVESSVFPTDYGEQLQAPAAELPAGLFENTPTLAQAAIGQNDVSATPLQMALVAAAVANDGDVPIPRVVTEVRNSRGETVTTPSPGTWQVAVGDTTALDLQLAMVDVVTDGTARGLAREGWRIGAKTGTAQIVAGDDRAHAWVIVFAGPVGGGPEIALAVLVEGVEGTAGQTGGGAAIPVARAVLDAYVGAG